MLRKLTYGALAVVAAAVTALPAQAQQSVADFYSGRTVTIVYGFGAGGTYGKYSLMLAEFLSKHIPGNPQVVASGKLTVVASGPDAAYEKARPHLEQFGRKVTYVGDGDEARLVKICHNLMLGVVAQSMAEISVLAEASGVSRADLFEFLNDSVMGSTFTKYKTPAFVNVDYTPTFTWHLLRKDFELGLSTANALDIPLPTAALVHQMIVEGIGLGYGDQDFAAMLTKQARASGRDVGSENREVSDGLS